MSSKQHENSGLVLKLALI